MPTVEPVHVGQRTRVERHGGHPRKGCYRFFTFGSGTLGGMVQLTTRERVDAFWSSTLGVDAADLHTPGVTCRSSTRRERVDWRGIYVLALRQGCLRLRPGRTCSRTITAAVAEHDAESLLEPTTWRTILGDQVQIGVRAGAALLPRRRVDGLDELAAGRRINPRDAEALAELRGAVRSEEWASAGFTAQPAMLFGIFDGDRLVAAANLTAGPDAATDVGIVVHPEARGQGLRRADRRARRPARRCSCTAWLDSGRSTIEPVHAWPSPTRWASSEYGRNLAVYLNDS